MTKALSTSTTTPSTTASSALNWFSDALGPTVLLFALAHGAAGAVFLATRHYDLKLHPLAPDDKVFLAIAGVGLLTGVVGLVSLTWHGLIACGSWINTERQARWPRTPVNHNNSFLLLSLKHIAFSAGLVGALVLQIQLIERGTAVAAVFTGLWFAAAMGCGAARIAAAYVLERRNSALQTSLIDPMRSLPTADALMDAAPPTWTFIVLVEALFHHNAGTWVPILEMSALLSYMSDEAMAMLLGPEALRLLGLTLAFMLMAGTWTVFWRIVRYRKTEKTQPRAGAPRGTRLLVWALIVGSGALAFAVSDVRTQRLALHHSHPSLHQAVGLMMPTLRAQLADRTGQADAQRLYPRILNAAGLPALKLSTTDTKNGAPAQPLTVAASQSGRSSTTGPLARNALIVFIDSISRRNLEPWGYPRPVDPNLKRLAAESIRFDQARSNAGQTDLATISLFYSLLPITHLDKKHVYDEGHGGRAVHLHAKDAGFAVGLFSADWEVHQVGHAALHPQRCDAFLDARITATATEAAEVVQWAGRRETEVVERFLDWHAEKRKTGRRTFSYVKFLRPHAPYYTNPNMADWRPPFQPAADSYNVFDFRPTAARMPSLRNRYDNAIHWTDHALGLLLTGLRKTGALEDTIIILLTDHGEGWGEHDLFGHSNQHFDEIIEVPLLLRLPGPSDAARAGVDTRRVSTIDVAPTLLASLGLPADKTYQGHSLLESRYRPRLHFAWSNNVGPIASLIIDEWKLIWIPTSDERWLFHLNDDPMERNNLSGQPGTATRERALLFLLKRICRSQLTYAASLLP